MIIDRNETPLDVELYEAARLVHDAARLEDIIDDLPRISRALGRYLDVMARWDSSRSKRDPKIPSEQHKRWEAVWFFFGFSFAELWLDFANRLGDDPRQQELKEEILAMLRKLATCTD
jgi:hypothetical protein